MAIPAQPAAVPLSAALLGLLSQFQTQSTALLSSLATPSLKPTEIIANLLTIDTRLAALVAQIPEHQAAAKEIADLAERINAYDTQWRADLSAAEAVRKELDILIRLGVKDRERINLAEQNRPSPDAILALGRQLAPFTAAPPDPQGPSPGPVDLRALIARGAIPPYPTEDALRRGALGFNDVAKPVGETTQVAAGPQRDTRDHAAIQQRYAERAQRQREEEQEDPFAIDLDLNEDLD